jgi:hypothetical protein
MLAFVSLLVLHAPSIMTVLAYEHTITVASTSGTEKPVASLAAIKNTVKIIRSILRLLNDTVSTADVLVSSDVQRR